MTEDPTKDLTTDEILRLILGRLDKLEAQGEDRARETRPRLDLIIAELADLREGQKDTARRLDRIESRLETLALDVVDVRADQRRLTGRMDDIERRPN